MRVVIFQMSLSILLLSNYLIAMEEGMLIERKQLIVEYYQNKGKKFWKDFNGSKKSIISAIEDKNSKMVSGKMATALVCKNFFVLFNLDVTVVRREWEISTLAQVQKKSYFFISTKQGKIYSVNLDGNQGDQYENIATINNAKIVDLVCNRQENALGVRYIPNGYEKMGILQKIKSKKLLPAKACLINLESNTLHFINAANNVYYIGFTEGNIENFITHKTIILKGIKQTIINEWFFDKNGNVTSDKKMTQQFTKKD